MRRSLSKLAVIFACVLWSANFAAAQDFENVEIKSEKVADHVYMLTGAGGNLGLCTGDDGAFLIDDQFAPLTDKITAAIGKLTDKPVRFLVNTHWHFDHTGGNENFGKAGAIIVAHENVRKRMSTDQFIEAFQRKVEAAPPVALPVITFAESLTFHWNGEQIDVMHVHDAHTDGDSVIYFRKSNVVHTGDVYFNGMYPFIDVGSGGSIDGMIAAAEQVLKQTDARTRIIPGHGELSDAAGLREYIAMLKTVSKRVHELVDQGKSREEVIAAGPTRDFDEKWGQGFLKPDVWVGIVYDGVVRSHKGKQP